jgi:hypothetical protein
LSWSPSPSRECMGRFSSGANFESRNEPSLFVYLAP